jgi:5-methyltetrahydrofolate--homocysteine methyltransferase
LPLIRELSIYTDLPLIVKANAGLPDPATGRYTVTAEQFAAHAADLAAAGVAYLGGCCGTDPTFISAVKAAAGDRPVPARAVPKQHILCSTPSKVLTSEGLLVVGERINPTGKPRFQEALRKNDLDYICRTALEQEAAGADLLDVNVGIPEINEAEFLREAIPAIQSVCPLPLQIDSADPAALEVGLRIYNGKALVNSVNGKQEQLTAVLPLVRRYGAAVIGLTLDETGIPDTAEGRLAIARRIVAACEQEGISRADLVIDCLALTVSAQPEGARETLRAIRLIREELGVKTILGISNISFGLPERGLINRSFLSMAAGSGLDLAILNPNDRDMMDTVAAARLLQQQDANGARFIARFAGDAKTKATVPDLPEPQVDLEQVLAEAVEKGLPAQAATATERLVGQIALQEIIDRILIPALDRVGEAFENGRIFLPQLIQSANAARKAFDCLRDHMRTGDRTAVNRGDILIATVEGDIHDIGKNIVKAILENYGYRVIDLGKNVPVETVVQKAIEEDVHLIGLSALMTTTLHNMARTIQALRKSGHPCKIMVGGAVLTPDYAEQIGADFYAKDAKASVDIAKIFFAEEEETDK